MSTYKQLTDLIRSIVSDDELRMAMAAAAKKESDTGALTDLEHLSQTVLAAARVMAEEIDRLDAECQHLTGRFDTAHAHLITEPK